MKRYLAVQAGLMIAATVTSSWAASGAAGYDQHLASAKDAANGVAGNLLRLCDLDGGKARSKGAMSGAQPLVEPQKVFDHLYYVGLERISAWAIDTSDGIILIDSLNSAKEAQDVIVPNLEKLGLDPKRLKMVIVSHGHGDHYGGAAYLAKQFNARVVASAIDWDLMAGPSPFPNAKWDAPPKRDQVVGDGEQLSLGDSKITFYVTPGHTPGTLSLIFDVTDNGTRHRVAFWGGTAFNFKPTAENFSIYEKSADRFGKIAVADKADVILSNHTVYDSSLANLAALRTRQAGQANPYVVGTEAVRDYFTVARECAAAQGDAATDRTPKVQ